jgi:predicted RNase H-like nuclease (RuvC/YqgF family)
MVFEVIDFHDLVRLLEERPKWRTELRRLILPDEILELPRSVMELVEAQRRAEARLQGVEGRLARSEARIEKVEARLEKVEARLEKVEARLEKVEARLEKVEARLEKVEARLEKVEARLEKVEARLERMEGRLGKLEGRSLESDYRDKAPSYFGRLLRKTRVVQIGRMADEMESRLTPEELDDLLQIDLVVKGNPRIAPDLGEVMLVVEISVVVDRNDINRAVRRADILRKTGIKAVPVAAGERHTEGAEKAHKDKSVVVFQNGTVTNWPEALRYWAA